MERCDLLRKFWVRKNQANLLDQTWEDEKQADAVLTGIADTAETQADQAA
jgi:hypothetical protein